jgi:hypothetical protein
MIKRLADGLRRAGAPGVCVVLLVAASCCAVCAGCGYSQGGRSSALVHRGGIEFVPAPTGTVVDDPVWLGQDKLLVTEWRQQFASLASVDIQSGIFAKVRTRNEPACRPTAAQFPTWRGRKIVYLTTCFGLVNRLPLSKRSGLAILDPRSGRNRAYGPYRFSVFMNGRFSFSPGGSRGVIDSGGLYSHLEWLTRRAAVPIRLALATSKAPAWSPNGELILFDGVPQARSDADVATLPSGLYTLDLANRMRLRIVIGGLRDDLRPSGAGWMPNSKWAVVAMEPPGQPNGIWIIDVMNGRKALLVAGAQFGRPAVSPSGRSVAVGVGVDAQIEPGSTKASKSGIDIIELPSNQLLARMLR